MRTHYYTSEIKAQTAATESTRMDGIARKVVSRYSFFVVVVA